MGLFVVSLVEVCVRVFSTTVGIGRHVSGGEPGVSPGGVQNIMSVLGAVTQKVYKYHLEVHVRDKLP